MLSQGQDRDLGEIDLLIARQRQQNIDGPAITIEIQQELPVIIDLHLGRVEIIHFARRDHDVIKPDRIANSAS